MPIFLCKARDADGRMVAERLDAPSAVEAAEVLEKRGLLPLAVQREAWAPAPSAGTGAARAGLFSRKPPLREMALMTRQLSTLVRAGVVIHTALDTVAAECESPALKHALTKVTQEVLQGNSFSKALAHHPDIFDAAFVNSIEAGQLGGGGSLDMVLLRLANYMEVANKRRTGVKAAMRYPVIVMATFTAAFFFLIRFVVPQFFSMFSRFGQQLPLPTRIMIGCHKAITTYGWITALALGTLVTLWIAFLRSPGGRRAWDRVKLTLPIFGLLYSKTAISTFVQTFNTMNESGVPILHNLDVAGLAVGNTEIQAALRKAREGVERGEPLSKQMKEIPQFPPLVAQMFAVGEKSGRMNEVLDPLIVHYDAEIQHVIEGLTAAIEPVLTVVMGALVLFLALGIFLPMWKFLHVVQEKQP